MTNIQIKRRNDFKKKLKNGKKGYSINWLYLENGINKGYSNGYSIKKLTGKAILLTEGELYTFTTEKPEDFSVLVADDNRKRLLVDIESDDVKKYFDVGYEDGKSDDFAFAAYFYTGIEEYLYVVNAFNQKTYTSCIELILDANESNRLVAAYELISMGIQRCHENAKQDGDFSLARKGATKNETF